MAALVAGWTMGFSLRDLGKAYVEAVWRIRLSLLTIAAMLALGHVTKYSGADATLGLALARTGLLYPFFGTLLGWLGVALTGSDTASNVLFGSLHAALRAVVHAGGRQHPDSGRVVIEQFDSLAAANDHFEFYWFPYGRKALVNRNNRLPAGGRAPRRPGCRAGAGPGSSR